MTHPYRDLTAEYRYITRRRQPSWITDPLLATLTTSAPDGPRQSCDRIVDMVRYYGTDEKCSDNAIRALAHIGAAVPDALTVLLYALAPELDFRLWRPVSMNYRIDALGDLAIVIRDATDAGDIDDLPALARRLTRRAHKRAYRQTLTPTWEDVWEGTWFEQRDETFDLAHRCEPVGDIAEVVALRLDLQSFVGTVEGQLDDATWSAYRYHRLVRAVDAGSKGSTDNTRAAANRAGRLVRKHVRRYLVVHT